MDGDLMVDFDRLLKRGTGIAYWVVDDSDENDAVVFTNLNLSKAEKAIEEMGITEQGHHPEAICVDHEAADQITPDLLERIISAEDQVDWPEDLDEQIEQRWHMAKKEKTNDESSRLSRPRQPFFRK